MLAVAPLWVALRQWPIVLRMHLGWQCSKCTWAPKLCLHPVCRFSGPQGGRAAFCTDIKLHLQTRGPLRLHRHPPAPPPNSDWACLQVGQMLASCRGTELTLPTWPHLQMWCVMTTEGSCELLLPLPAGVACLDQGGQP